LGIVRKGSRKWNNNRRRKKEEEYLSPIVNTVCPCAGRWKQQQQKKKPGGKGVSDAKSGNNALKRKLQKERLWTRQSRLTPSVPSQAQTYHNSEAETLKDKKNNKKTIFAGKKETFNRGTRGSGENQGVRGADCTGAKKLTRNHGAAHRSQKEKSFERSRGTPST